MEVMKMYRKIMSLAFIISLSISVLLSPAVADGGPEHQVEQPRPILLGTSGGNINDISWLYCCSGTLGALVENGENQFILSNNHVLARTNLGDAGDAIIQPGLIDQYCQQDTSDTVAYLSDFVTLRFKSKQTVPINKVDAAIAEVIPGKVDPDGGIIDIGQVSSQTAAATVGMAVKKSGRTTGLTSGVVQSINVTVDVKYSDECGGAANKLARFQNQILIGPAGFSAGGDSGSLIVEDVAVKPRAVGLLFAGSPSVTVANPIDEVLSTLGVVMPGAAPPSEPKGSISGRVTNTAGGAAIEGAKVSVDTGQSSVTNSTGNYLIENVPVGQHIVSATASGFKPASRTVTVNENQDTTANFALQVQKGKRPKPRKTALDKAIAAKNKHENAVMAIDGVVGVGVGRLKENQPVVQVYLKSDSGQTRKKIPKTVDDVPVQVVVTGEFEAF
jgi:hypothetical protein